MTRKNIVVSIGIGIVLGILLNGISCRSTEIALLKQSCIELEEENKHLKSSNLALVDVYNKAIEMKCNSVYDAMTEIESIKDENKYEYFIRYKQILDDYNCEDKPETVYDYFTEEQIRMMWKCIETETYDCPFEIKVNVACVILNRVEHDMFPTDPVEIITAHNQFKYGRNIITEDTKLALEYAYEIEDTTNGCIGFRSDANPQEWNNWEYQFTDNYHYFYKMKGE